ncbi:MAG TPA: lysine-2,3-aminomutase-like protein [Rhizomicrobium sp.]|nr:lysine-2,3-aminomutase-like protein [Rhizomicrobium sp.]HWC62035.1 lysine-2,3-aminomutase-like protein [Rhizomicrobium sp.]
MTLALVARKYAVAVSPTVEALIDPADPCDPIARQFLPDIAELVETEEERADPIGDHPHQAVPGIVHRHPDRVLFKAVASCPVYCRFCFRREQIGPGKTNMLSPEDLERAFQYIQTHPEIWEVILTGGDPFILSPRRAAGITGRLAATGHVKIIRWHTRVPMVDPSRVSDDFIAALLAPAVTPWIAIHANHPREFSPDARRALARLADAGIPLVSQTVLLKGINDDVETLASLMRAFVENRVKPYYLHHPDLARGTSHFRPTIQQGLELTRALRARHSGLAQPLYVLDIPGGHGKVPLDSNQVEKSAGGYRIRDFKGRWHDYRG